MGWSGYGDFLGLDAEDDDNEGQNANVDER